MKKIYLKTGLILSIEMLICLGCIAQVDQVVSIEEINEKPREYHGKIVTVIGEVISSYEVPFLHFYKIQDIKGNTISIITEELVPNEGEKVKITGKVNRLYKIASYQMVVIEEEK